MFNDDIMIPFASSIFAKVKYLNEKTLSSFEHQRILESISEDIKKCTNFIAPLTSEAAKNKALSMNIRLNEMTWHNQPKYDKGRQIFHFEHLVPVSCIRKMCLNCISETEVLEILNTIPKTIWILKSEDRKLTMNGFRSKRENPEEVYNQLGIQIVYK